jgi:type 2A phosphatase activator TIP41
MSLRDARVETATCGGGWRATSTATPIVNRERIRALELSTNAPTTPEMLFDSALELTHESGVTLRFHAEDALREWVALDLPAVKVAAAETWTRAHVERFGDGDAGENDGSTATATATTQPSTTAAAPASSSWNSTEKSASYDWTFTTPYGGSVVADAGVDPAPSWTTTERRIDRGMLTERDPIQMYDELTLYESELDDNGVAHLGLKVRVMPKCWYVLLRFWLRVDGVLIRLRETRFFCDTTARDQSGAVIIVRETQHREETWDALRARGAPCEPRQFPDPDHAASVLLAAGGPVDITHHELVLRADVS